MVLHPVMRVVFFLGYITVIIVAIIGAANIPVGQKLSDIPPSDSYFKTYMDVYNRRLIHVQIAGISPNG